MKNLVAAFRKDIMFMIILATTCSVLIMATRTAVGEKAEIPENAVEAVAALSLADTGLLAFDAVKKNFIRRSSGRFIWWQATEKPELWACLATGAGMWAEIRLVFVYRSDQQRIIGMRVIDQNETAGLGDRIADPSFYEQFDDILAAGEIRMALSGAGQGQFDAITGATVTSNAVQNIINRALKQQRSLTAASVQSGGRS